MQVGRASSTRIDHWRSGIFCKSCLRTASTYLQKILTATAVQQCLPNRALLTSNRRRPPAGFPDDPSLPHRVTPNKSTLLAKVTKLHLVYLTERLKPDYLDLLAHGDWNLIGEGKSEQDTERVWEALEEMDRYRKGIGNFSSWKNAAM